MASVQQQSDRDRILGAAAALGMVGPRDHVAQRILARLCDPQVSIPQLAAIIGQDPGITARVLRVSNSAYYGLSRHVATVERALFVLGSDAVRGIAAAACVDRALMRAGLAAQLPLEALVRHSLAAAVAAERLALACQRPLAGDAFIAGLLHNLGALVQAQLAPDGIRALVAKGSAPADIRDAERSAGLLPHEACAGVVFAAWQLPEGLVEAASHHHAPSGAAVEHQPLAALLHAGIDIATRSGLGWSLEPPVAGERAWSLARIGAGEELAAAAAAGLAERVALLEAASA